MRNASTLKKTVADAVADDEEEVVYQKKPKRKRRVVVVQDSSEEEIEVRLPKKDATQSAQDDLYRRTYERMFEVH